MVPTPPDPPASPSSPPSAKELAARVAALTATAVLLATTASRHHGPGERWSLALLVLAPPLLVALGFRAGDRSTLARRLARWILALPLVSGALHALALSGLIGETVVGASGVTARAARDAVLEGTLLHLVLPAALLTFLGLFGAAPASRGRWLRLAPLFVVPTALVAIYQAAWDLDRWNVAHFVRHGRASGLAYDANSLAATLVLILPWTVASASCTPSKWERRSALAAAVLFGGALVSTGNRAALATALVAAALAPWAVRHLAPELSQGRRRIVSLVPLAAFLAFGLLWLGLPSRRAEPQDGFARLAETAREARAVGLGELLRSSGRAELWTRAIRIWRRAPVAGVGPGGFARELSNDRFQSDLPGLDAVPDLAASHFLQIAAELGGIGLLAHATLLALAIAAGFRSSATRRTSEAATRLSAWTILVAAPLLQFNHYLLFPDTSWILGLLLAAAIASRREPGTSTRPRRWTGAFVLAAFALFTLRTTFGSEGYVARASREGWSNRFDDGCYGIERWDGTPTRWCEPDAWISVPIDRAGGEAIAFDVWASHPDLASRPVKVRVTLLDGRSWERVFDSPRWWGWTIPSSERALVACRDAQARRSRCLAVHVETSRSWRPSDFGSSADDRELGVAVRARTVVDLRRLPTHLFDDGFEEGDTTRWGPATRGSLAPP